MGNVLIPGSFDPITLGHLDIIRRAAARFASVTVAVMNNDMHQYVEGARVKQYRFSIGERREMAELACAELPNVRVIAAGGLLIKLFDTMELDWIIKGVRSTADFEYEQTHALWNRAHDSRAETLYMPADPAFDDISSTLVRERLSRREPVDDLVPAAVAAYIREHTRPL